MLLLVPMIVYNDMVVSFNIHTENKDCILSDLIIFVFSLYLSIENYKYSTVDQFIDKLKM